MRFLGGIQGRASKAGAGFSHAWQQPEYAELRVKNDDVAFLSARLAAALGRKAGFCATIKIAASFRDTGRRLAREHGGVSGDTGISKHESASQRITLESRLARGQLNNSPDLTLQMAGDIAAFHRERWDGRGFPSALKAEEIPYAARIVAICVTYHVLTMETRHGAHWLHDDAINYIRSQSRSRFDPDMVDAFLRLHGEDPEMTGA